jgi:hypothetical protein
LNNLKNKFKEGDWIRVDETRQFGVIEKIMPSGEYLVRIPSLNDWPFPKWDVFKPEAVTKARMPKKPKPPLPTEEALW